jgi:hypothetical protein
VREVADVPVETLVIDQQAEHYGVTVVVIAKVLAKAR